MRAQTDLAVTTDEPWRALPASVHKARNTESLNLHQRAERAATGRQTETSSANNTEAAMGGREHRCPVRSTSTIAESHSTSTMAYYENAGHSTAIVRDSISDAHPILGYTHVFTGHVLMRNLRRERVVKPFQLYLSMHMRMGRFKIRFEILIKNWYV